MTRAGLTLPPPLILTSPQAATINLLYSPTLVEPQPSSPPRLTVPSAPASSSSPSPRQPRPPISAVTPPSPPTQPSTQTQAGEDISRKPLAGHAERTISDVGGRVGQADEQATRGVPADGPDEDPSDLAVAWRLFEKAIPGLTSTRIPLLLQALAADDTAIQVFLDGKMAETVDVDTKCRHLDTLFLMLTELNGDEAAASEGDWRPTVAVIFVRFFSCLWDHRDERVRSQATILSASLFPAHFELVAQCMEAYLDQADSAGRARCVSFLVRLHPYFPRWRVLNWSVVWNLLFEEEYNIDQRTRSAAGGGRSSVYSIGDSSDAPVEVAGAEHLRTQLLDLALLWIGDGIAIDLFSLLKIKHHVVSALGFDHSEIVPSRDGQTFCIQFSNLSAFSPVALSVVSGLKRVLDCSEHLDLPPSAMDVFLDEDPPTSHLVGAAFADVVLSVVNSKVGIRKLPYLEQRCWLECLLILVYKHDFDSDSLVHLEPSLLEALKTVTALSPVMSPDNQQIVITICKVLIEQWDEAVVAKVISRLISNVGKLLTSLGPHSTGPLPSQARVFLRRALSHFGERGVYLLQLKEASDPKLVDTEYDLFAVLPAVFQTPGEIQQVYRDVMRSLTSVNIPRPAFSLILKSLATLTEVGGTKRLPGNLIAEFGTFFAKVARHTTGWSGSDLDPNPLLLVACSVLTGSRARSSVVYPDVIALLQAFLSRFDVHKDTITAVANSTHLAASLNDRSAVAVVVEAAETGLTGTGRVQASALSSAIEFLLSLPSPITVTDLRQPSLDPSQLVHLGPPALSFIARSNSHSTADSIALLSAARLILAADRGDMAVLGRLLVEQVATELDAPDHLRLYNWLALASLLPNNSVQPTTSRLLALVPFATYACTTTLLRALGPRPPPGASDRSAEHLSAGFAFMKLWLLLARTRQISDVVVTGVEDRKRQAKGQEREVWDACWFAWDRLLRNSSSLSPTIATVLHNLLFDLSLFLDASAPGLLLTCGPTLEHHLLLLRAERPTAKLTKALKAVRAGGMGGLGGRAGNEMSEIGAAAEDLKAAERLRSLGGL